MSVDKLTKQRIESLETKVDSMLIMLLNMKKVITIAHVEDAYDGDNTEGSDSED